MAASSGLAASIGGPVWAATMAGILVASQVFAKVLDRKIKYEDVKRGKHREIAMLYDAQQRFDD